MGNTNFSTRQAIAKFFSPYTLPAQGSIWTMCRSIPNLVNVEHFFDPDEKDLFLKFIIREIRKFTCESLFFIPRQTIAKINFVLESRYETHGTLQAGFSSN